MSDFMERGYTEGWETGVKAERERIIALLKNLIGNREAAIYVDEFIALIKGEHK